MTHVFVKNKKTDREKFIAAASGFIVGGLLGYAVDWKTVTDAFQAVTSGIDITALVQNKKGYIQFMSDLEDFSGMDLDVEDINGRKILTYRAKKTQVNFSFNKKKEKRKWQTVFSKPVKNSEGGSKKLKKILKTAIKSQRTVNVTLDRNKEVSSDVKSDINLNPDDIEKEMEGAKGMDKRTWGWGFAFLHELFHTKPGGGLTDGGKPETEPGPVERILNEIRRQLGPEFGQRLYYFRPGSGFIPFDEEALKKINEKAVPGPGTRRLEIVKPPNYVAPKKDK